MNTFEIDSFTFKIIVCLGIISFLPSNVPERDMRDILTLSAACSKCVTSHLVIGRVCEIAKTDC